MSGTSKPGRIPGKARKPVVFSKPPVIITVLLWYFDTFKSSYFQDDDDDNKPSDVSGLRRNIDNRRSGSMKQFFQKVRLASLIFRKLTYRTTTLFLVLHPYLVPQVLQRSITMFPVLRWYLPILKMMTRWRYFKILLGLSFLFI